MTNRRISLAIASLLALQLAGCAGRMPFSAPPEAPLKVQVLAINDFHGNLLPPAAFRMPDPADPTKTLQIPAGGAEALATAVKQLRANQPNHIFVAAGDLIGGSPLLSALFRDEPTIEALSTMGLHLSAVGNHEFDLGRDELLRRQNGGCHPVDGCKGPKPFKGASFQYLAASTIDTATGKTLLPAYQIRNFEGVPVAFVGLTLKSTPSLVMPTGVAGLRFDDEATTVNRLVPELKRQGAAAIVVMLHEGGYPTGGYNECPGISGPIVDIVNRLDKAVNVVVTGHTHRAYNCVINGMRVTSGDKFGSMITNITLNIDRKARKVLSTTAENTLVRLDTFTKDAEQSALLAGYIERAKPLTDRVVGRLGSDIRQSGDASGQSPMGLLVADAQLAATRAPDMGGAQAAFTNSGGVRAGFALRPEGTLTFGDLFTVQPFSNELITMTLSGKELLDILERQWRKDGRFDALQVSSGFAYTWDANAPVGQRVVAGSVRIGGQPLDTQRDYRITVNAFIASGGDSFTGFGAGRDRRVGVLDVKALEAHVASLGTVTAPVQNRIQRLN